MNRQQRRAAQRSEANRQQAKAAPTEWAAMNHRQRREQTRRRS
ncbi:MAG TPA: hypothetical protein VFY11_15895 [Nocardioidaceae bacterium]|nr:hypothetical protein [Nocardioidaceae bacterium]